RPGTRGRPTCRGRACAGAARRRCGSGAGGWSAGSSGTAFRGRAGVAVRGAALQGQQLTPQLAVLSGEFFQLGLEATVGGLILPLVADAKALVRGESVARLAVGVEA